MIKIRSALILLVALSIAMLPAGMSAKASAHAPVESGSTVVSMSSAGDQEGMSTDKMMNDCQASAGCAWKCFGLCNLSFEPKVHHPFFGKTTFFFPQKVFDSRQTSPPFRPPRI